jgi:two-component system, OmpR family, phosphate regulon sensor histidine kinase PhoR
MVTTHMLLANDADVAGWAVAALIAGAWVVSEIRRTRSAARLRDLLADETSELREEEPFPYHDEIASAAMRRVRVERERHELANRRLSEIERILRATPIAVIALDHKQRISSANAAAERLLGFTIERARTRLLQEIVRQPELNRAIETALGASGRFDGELHLEADDPLEVHLCCEPLDMEHEPAGLVMSLVDVTRMRRLESMRSEFAANVSHELRTPITNIKGYVETLLQVGIDDPERMRKFLEIVHRNTVRLSGIVEDILTLAFLEEPEAKQSLTQAPISARDVVGQVVEDLGSAASAKAIQVVVSAESTRLIVANRSLIEQAMANLISNAIKYSGERTTVHIGITDVGDAIRLAVSDEGPGIAAKHLPRIFERFYRVDKARARSQGGTGLGLAIVKHIATIHGGRVEVSSQLGQGSTFSLFLPAAVGAHPAAGVA